MLKQLIKVAPYILQQVVRTGCTSSRWSTVPVQKMNQFQQKPSFVLRSLFYVKQSKVLKPEQWFRKVPADAFVLDLEDSVPACKKEQARQNIFEVGNAFCLLRHVLHCALVWYHGETSHNIWHYIC